MAVYKRNYKRYEGPLTEQRWRFTILPRYSFKTVFESKLFTSFFTMCFLPPLLAIAIIYIKQNLAAFQSINLQALRFLTVDGNFFLRLFSVQTFLSFLIVTLVGPGLIAPDLANNALPLYLSRPFSRWEYVLGKLTVLIALTSLVTWIPGLLVVGVQVNTAGLSWLWDNLRLPLGIFAGSWIWLLTISLIALALSAWVKFKPIAAASLLVLFFASAAFGDAANGMLGLRPPWGSLMNLRSTMAMIWAWLLLGQTTYNGFAPDDPGLPVWSGLVAMLTFCCVALLMLARKIRATEVVRG